MAMAKCRTYRQLADELHEENVARIEKCENDPVLSKEHWEAVKRGALACLVPHPNNDEEYIAKAKAKLAKAEEALAALARGEKVSLDHLLPFGRGPLSSR